MGWMTEYYKILTNDFRSPIQGGEPIFDGVVPCVLPKVSLDQSDKECGAGWNFCQSAHVAFRVAGLWPDGWPSRLYRVEPIGKTITRDDKCRAAQIRILEQIVDVEPYVRRLSEPFGDHTEKMCEQQMMWREALSRPFRDRKLVEEGLARALATRGLQWSLKRFPDVPAARTARDLWVALDALDALDAWNAWDAWNTRDAWSAWNTRDTWSSWNTRTVWNTRDAWYAWNTRTVWDAWDAKDAKDALSVFYVVKMGWIDRTPELLTTGIREAYASGLGIALPTGPDELGWAMTG
jgi:hypothetical protein